MLNEAREHYRRQQRLTALGLIAARRVADSPVRAAAVVTAFQLAAAEDAAAAVPLMLAEQGIDTAAEGVVNTRALSGVASDGRPLVSLLEQAETSFVFDLMVTTQLQDMARMAGSLGGISRPAVKGYVRMLNTPSCSRCVVLAGRVYKMQEAFDRHPKCDCRHVPVDEDTADDLRTDPKAYFNSLPSANRLDEMHPNLTAKARREAGLFSQEDIFTKAGAQAIRDGADIRQVVNARRGARGMAPAGGRYTLAEQRMLQGGKSRGGLQRVNVFGQEVFITSEGITRRGIAGQVIGRRSGFVGQEAETVTRNTRRGAEARTVTRQRAKAIRLMPESIYEIATDREDAIRLLKAHGYLL